MRRIVLAALAAVIAPSLSYFSSRPDEVHAGSALRLEVEDLVQRSDQAFEGRVTARTSRLDAKGRIETEYVVSVSRAFVGSGGATRTFRMPGGVLPDGRGMVIPGMPMLAQGEDVLVFLSPETARGSRMPIGLAQGKLRVVTAADGRKTLVKEQADIELVDAHGAPARKPGEGATLDYATTIARIEAAAQDRAAAAKKKAGAR